jgi:hypothetical protein
MSFINAPQDSALVVAQSSNAADLERRFFGALFSWFERARRAGAIRALNVRQAAINLIGPVVLYPAVASSLGGGEVAGAEPFSAKAVKISQGGATHRHPLHARTAKLSEPSLDRGANMKRARPCCVRRQ